MTFDMTFSLLKVPHYHLLEDVFISLWGPYSMSFELTPLRSCILACLYIPLVLNKLLMQMNENNTNRDWPRPSIEVGVAWDFEGPLPNVYASPYPARYLEIDTRLG